MIRITQIDMRVEGEPQVAVFTNEDDPQGYAVPVMGWALVSDNGFMRVEALILQRSVINKMPVPVSSFIDSFPENYPQRFIWLMAASEWEEGHEFRENMKRVTKEYHEGTLETA